MGQGGRILLVNNTKSDWIRTYNKTYQMNAWHSPERVSRGESVQFYFEWNQNPFQVNPCDDSATSQYRLGDTGFSFKVRAQASGGYFDYSFNTFIDLCNLKIIDHNQKIYPMGWKHNGTVCFMLYEEEGRYFIKPIDAENFMDSYLNIFKNKTLKDICIAGSHNAGMYELNGSTMFITEGNTLNQSLSIGEQLKRGVRYFDIRPVIGNGGEYRVGHYSGKVDIGTLWSGRLGGNGALISTIVKDINNFLKTHKNELIVLNLSHAYNTDSSYRDFNAKEWEKLLSILKGLNRLFLRSAIKDKPLLDIKLGTILSIGNVIIRVEGFPSGLALPDFIFKNSEMGVYDKYSNTSDVKTMISDQISKMKKADHSQSLFLLSWTLTLSGSELAFGDIRRLANMANAELSRNLLPAISKDCYPNIIYVDNVVDSIAAFNAMTINLNRHNKQLFSFTNEHTVYPHLDTANSERYIKQAIFILADSTDDALNKCPSDFKLYEDIVCNNEEGKPIFICYQETTDSNLAMKTIDGTNNGTEKVEKLPIKEIAVADNKKIPSGWEIFANINSFIETNEKDRYIIVKR